MDGGPAEVAASEHKLRFHGQIYRAYLEPGTGASTIGSRPLEGEMSCPRLGNVGHSSLRNNAKPPNRARMWRKLQPAAERMTFATSPARPLT